MDVKWVKIRSWHAVEPNGVNLHNRAITKCGRLAIDVVAVDDLPAEKSCESCLRIVARRADQA